MFLESELETSARFFHLVWRSTARGILCLPARGIGSVPRLLAARLPEGTVRLDSPLRGLTDRGGLLHDGTERPAGTVAVATDAATAARLLPGLDVPPGRTVTTYYHATGRSPLPEPTLVVATYTVEDALPAMRPPWPLHRDTRWAEGRHVCGDQRATGSVQGALASGSRAARDVLADLRSGPHPRDALPGNHRRDGFRP